MAITNESYSMIGPQADSRFQNVGKLGSDRSTPSRSVTPSSPQVSRNFARNATIVLVGTRGSGKRSLGFIGATHLGRRLITEDHYFEEVTGISRKEFLSRYGNKDFQKKNVEVIHRMLYDNRANCIIECGMGSLAREAQTLLREYSKTHPVIHVLRNPDRIRQLLKLSESDSKRLEHADRAHHSCSNFEYYNLHDPSSDTQSADTPHDRASPNYSSGLKDAKQDFSKFLDFITGLGAEKSSFESPFSLTAVPPEYRPYTYALSVRLSDLVNGNVDFSQLDPGGDAFELRIDVWIANMLSFVDKQVAQIRRITGLPVIFHVEESISANEDSILILLHHGLRLGVDYLAVSLGLQDESIRQLVQAKGGTKIIGHWFVKEPVSSGWKDSSRFEIFRRASWLSCDIARIVQVALSKKDNDDLRVFVDTISTICEPHPILIAYNLGTLGTTSLVSNKTFTPVTHHAIKGKNKAPNDSLITSQEAMQALFQTSVYDPLHFYIFGITMAYSPSPMMHNAAYRVRGMHHDFQIQEASSLDDLHQLSKDPHFGGAAIGQPFKVAIMAHLHAQSHHSRAIGAINTILPLRALPDGSPGFLLNQANLRNCAGTVCAWYGDNTDWIGISACLRRNLSPRNAVQPSKTTGLVIGAGGMARAAIYAMIQLGCRKIFIFNRTVENAENVAQHFNSWAGSLSDTGSVVRVLKSRDEPWPEEYQPPTMMVSCVPAQRLGSRPAADFQMPIQWLGSPSGGVILEVRDRLLLIHFTSHPQCALY
jgi:3-dehydroquinate dehydratase type I